MARPLYSSTLQTTDTSAASITMGGGMTAGTGSVLLVTTAGKITALSSTYVAAITSDTAGKILRSNGTSFLNSTATYPDTITVNQILYATGANAIGSAAAYVFDGSTQTISSAAVILAQMTSSSTDAAAISITNSNSARNWTAAVAGGTNLSSVASGSFYLKDETAGVVRLAIATTGAITTTTTAVYMAALTSTSSDAALLSLTSGSASRNWAEGIAGSANVLGLAQGTWYLHDVTSGAAPRMTVSTGGAVNFPGTVTMGTYTGQSSIVTVGTLTGGATGAGFTIALTTSTVTGTLPAANFPALTGDVTTSAGSVATTLATVATAGTTGSSTAIPVVTINAKGLTTGITTAAVVAPAGTLTGTTLAANVVTSSLTSVGTIGTGAWQGTLVGLTYGGTNANLTAANGGLVYSTATALAILAAGSSGQIPRSGGAGAPSWSTATFPATASTTGAYLRADGTNWIASTLILPNAATVNQLAYATAANTYGGSSGLQYDATALTVNGPLKAWGVGAGSGLGVVEFGTYGNAWSLLIGGAAKTFLTHNLYTDDGFATIRFANSSVNSMYMDMASGFGFEWAYCGSGTAGNSASVTSLMSLSEAGALSVSATTDASSSTTGTVIVSGGVGVAKKLYVGTTAVVSTSILLGTATDYDEGGKEGKQSIGFSYATNWGLYINETASTSGAGFLIFGLGAGTGSSGIGSVTRVGATSAVAYNATSDRRLKIDHGTDVDLTPLRSLSVHDAEWIDPATGDPTGTRYPMFFAQQAHEAAPFIVTAGDSHPVVVNTPWSTHNTELIPLMTAGWQQHDRSIRELQQLVQSLAARVH